MQDAPASKKAYNNKILLPVLKTIIIEKLVYKWCKLPCVHRASPDSVHSKTGCCHRELPVHRKHAWPLSRTQRTQFVYAMNS